MAGVPAELSTDHQPPLTIPLRHFLVGLAFLVGAGLLGTLVALDWTAGWARLAHLHLLVVGWVAITIMGAMTQFVPVWSGTTIHSERLALAQLWLVTAGLLGFVAALLAGRPGWLFLPGGVMLVGFWVFAYNLGRTLGPLGPADVTERHFLVALGFFVLLTGLGFVLAVDLAHPVLRPIGLGRANVVAAHASLAVYGALLTTLIGALYQLGPMFTQTQPSALDARLQTLEDLAYPVGVLALAGGRLADHRAVATIGGVLVAASVFAVGLVLARRLVAARVAWTPMLVRYAVAAPAMLSWAALAAMAWVARPLGPTTLLGAPGTGSLLLLGVIGFAVMGTLYHVVPFIVWLHRYSDRIGFEPVPMIDDLYHARLATVEFGVVLVGSGGLVLTEGLGLPSAIGAASMALLTVGLGLFAANLLLVIRHHSPRSFRRLLFGGPERPPPSTAAD